MVGFFIIFGLWQGHFDDIGIGQRRNNQEKQQQKKHNVTQGGCRYFGVKSSFSFDRHDLCFLNNIDEF